MTQAIGQIKKEDLTGLPFLFYRARPHVRKPGEA